MTGSSDRGYRVMRLGDMDAVPWKESMTWHPVRAHLGIRAFGAAAFSAQQPGEWVVEPHTELEGRGHEELYLVVAGHAAFRLDGEELDAPQGTFVFVKDPAVRRQAVAVEAGTTVLVLGGDPVFQPAGEEVMARVRAVLDDPPAARALAEEGRRELGPTPGVTYAAALAAAAAGDHAEAARLLRSAIDAVPALADEADGDPILASARRRLA
jgi:hypothetical protein